MQQITRFQHEKFRLDVDSLHAASHFHDLPDALRVLAAREGMAYARAAFLALALRVYADKEVRA